MASTHHVSPAQAPTGAPVPEGRPSRPPRLAIIASKGTLDWAYPPLMLATQAAEKGWEDLLHVLRPGHHSPPVESGVTLIPCGMTIDVFGYKAADFIPGVRSRLGSSDFLDFAKDANVTLFI